MKDEGTYRFIIINNYFSYMSLPIGDLASADGYLPELDGIYS